MPAKWFSEKVHHTYSRMYLVAAGRHAVRRLLRALSTDRARSGRMRCGLGLVVCLPLVPCALDGLVHPLCRPFAEVEILALVAGV